MLKPLPSQTSERPAFVTTCDAFLPSQIASTARYKLWSTFGQTKFIISLTKASVGLSFDQPVETMESISIAMLNLLELIRFADKSMKLYNAGSGECLGEAPEISATPFQPRSPYARSLRVRQTRHGWSSAFTSRTAT
jgi:nucleoside-diphosphate-sugar epimerase